MKKITLSKDTLRVLTAQEVDEVAGAAPSVPPGCLPSRTGGRETKDNPPFICMTNQATCTQPTG